MPGTQSSPYRNPIILGVAFALGLFVQAASLRVCILPVLQLGVRHMSHESRLITAAPPQAKVRRRQDHACHRFFVGDINS